MLSNGADQEDHIEIASHQCDVVNLRDGAQLLARMLAHLQRHVGGGLQLGLDGVHQGRELGQHPFAGQAGDSGVRVGAGDVAQPPRWAAKREIRQSSIPLRQAPMIG